MSNINQKKGVDLSGLDAFNVSDLVQSNPVGSEDENLIGKILSIEIDKLHEDPHNTRTVFDEDKLKELVESITAINPVTKKPRGIKTPLSVRPHPDVKGEYIVNAGHRRLRAAKMAGMTEVPVYIDSDANHYDNTVDNLQREDLSAMELAMFIAKRVEAGDSKSEIAKQIGRPASIVSDHAVFFDLPIYIRELYDEQICQSMQGLAILHRANKHHQEEVERFCIAQEEELTVKQIRDFVDSLKVKETPKEKETADVPVANPKQSEPIAENSSDTPELTDLKSTKFIESEELSEIKAANKEADESLVEKIIELKQLVESVRQGDADSLDMMELLIDDLLIEASR